MLSHGISAWSATWSVHDQPGDHFIRAMWSVHDLSRDLCMTRQVVSVWSATWSVHDPSPKGVWSVTWPVHGSYMVIAWSATWVVHDSHVISAWSVTWSVDDQLRDQGLSRVFSNTTVQKHHSSALNFLYGSTLTSICDHWKNHSFD